MSLINQVLRDLDKRRAASGAAAPAAVKASALKTTQPGALRRATRWGIGLAATATAVVAGGMAQGSIQWPGRPSAAPVAAAVPVAVAMPMPAPTPVATAKPAPVAEPVVQALAVPSPKPSLVAPPPPPALKVHARELPAAPAAVAAAASPRFAEARIDKRATNRTPQERAEAHYQRGVTAHQAGLIDESATAFVAALREEPGFAPARQAQAGLLIGQSRLDEALALLQEGIALAPQQTALALMLARLQTERQDLAGATSTLKTALPRATNNAEYLGFYAAILQRANRHAEASEQFGTALRLSPANSVWWMGLGISLAAEGQAGAAREAFMRAKTTGALSPEAGQYVELRLRQMM